MTARQIAIDGPAGAGKSSVAKLVAGKLGYLYIDTGAMYRAVALNCLRHEVSVADEKSVLDLIQKTEFVFLPGADGCRVMIEKEDVCEAIRQPQVGNAASAVSTLPGVRNYLVQMQQRLGAEQPVIMDGRDIGTVVLPYAKCKIFLTASVEVRAQRRTEELLKKGQEADYDRIKKEIEERDYRDSHREHSPLKQAEDAILLDTSDMTIEQVVAEIIRIAELSNE